MKQQKKIAIKTKKNSYAYRTHLSEYKLKQILKCFVFDLDAKKTSEMTDITRNTVNRFFMLLRERIAEICEKESPFPKGIYEIDESYFGSRRVKGMRGRGAGKKTPLFGILKRGGRSIPRLSLIVQGVPLLASSRVKLISNLSSILTPGDHMTVLSMLDMKSTSGRTTATMSFP